MRYPLRILVALVTLAAAAPASAERALTLRFAAHAAGDVLVLGNTLETCATSDPACAGARAGLGPAPVNNAFASMGPVDVDDDPATFDSASVALALPAAARVLFAGLYWGADASAGTGGAAAPDASAAGRVLVHAPGAHGYTAVAAAVVDRSGTRYQGFADVTDLVRGAAAGPFTVADVQAGTGADRYAGFALVVAVAVPGAQPRSLDVFDGLLNVATTSTINLDGLRAPPVGPVQARIGVVAYDGDRGIAGDSLAVDGHLVRDPSRPLDDFFASVIESPDGPIARLPSYDDQLGFDAKVVEADGVLAPGATAAGITLATTGDVYLPGVVTVSAHLYAPRLVVRSTLTDVDGGGLRQGDVVALRIVGSNAGDDAGEIGAHAVRARLGAGASAAVGGLLAPGAPIDVQARCRVGRDVALGTPLRADGFLRYHAAGAPGDTFADLVGAGPLVVATRPRSDLALRLAVVGAVRLRARRPVVVRVGIRNDGPAAAERIRVDVALPPGVVVVAAPAACAPGAAALSCPIGRLRVGARATFRIVVRALRAGRFELRAVTVAARRNSGGLNTAALVLRVAPAPRRADLRVALVPPRDPRAGRVVRLRVRIASRGPDVAVGGRAAIVVPAGVDLLSARGAHLRCRVRGAVARCALAPLHGGDTAEIGVRLRVATAGRYVVRAFVAAAAIDPTPGNAAARAVLRVRTPTP